MRHRIAAPKDSANLKRSAGVIHFSGQREPAGVTTNRTPEDGPYCVPEVLGRAGGVGGRTVRRAAGGLFVV
jgi:hypothetical protein